MQTLHKIILGDSRRMRELKDESAHFVVTYSPYWHLKDYGNDNQIGFNDRYKDYISNFNLQNPPRIESNAKEEKRGSKKRPYL